MDSKQFREAAVSSIDEIVKYYDTIEERPVLSTVEPGYLRKLLPTEAPEDGEPWDNIQKDIESKIQPGLTHWQSPNFLAWFPAASSFPAMLGDMYSTAFTNAGFNWVCSPAVTELETIVLDWLAKALALPPCYLSSGPTNGGGVIHGTASETIATTMVAARDRFLREATEHILDEEEREDAVAIRRMSLVAIGSAATHSATKKAAQITGVRYRTVPVHAKDGYRMTGVELAKMIKALRAKGLEPFYVTATLGTTDTCAIDDMEGIADVLEEDYRSQFEGGIPTTSVNEIITSNGQGFTATYGNGTTMNDARDTTTNTHVCNDGNGVAALNGNGVAHSNGTAHTNGHTNGYTNGHTNGNGHHHGDAQQTTSASRTTKRKRPEIWVHVDAAYAGVALICPEYQHLSAVLSRFHSFETNWHKWLLVNFDCSTLWVRDRNWLIEALSVTPLAILRNVHTESGLVTDYRDWQIPFGRRFRSLKLWFVLRTYGIRGLQAHIRKHVGLAEKFADMVNTRKDLFEIVTGPRFALTLIRLVGSSADAMTSTAEAENERNALTKQMYDSVIADGRIFLSSTVLGGTKYAIRHNPATPFVELHHVERHFDILAEMAERTLVEAGISVQKLKLQK